MHFQRNSNPTFLQETCTASGICKAGKSEENKKGGIRKENGRKGSLALILISELIDIKMVLFSIIQMFK